MLALNAAFLNPPFGMLVGHPARQRRRRYAHGERVEIVPQGEYAALLNTGRSVVTFILIWTDRLLNPITCVKIGEEPSILKQTICKTILLPTAVSCFLNYCTLARGRVCAILPQDAKRQRGEALITVRWKRIIFCNMAETCCTRETWTRRHKNL